MAESGPKRFDARRRGDPIPYAEVAEIVRGWPAVAGYARHIADVYGIPLPSAHRWVYQTRRRGLLPSGVAARPCRTCGGTGVQKWGKRDHSGRSDG